MSRNFDETHRLIMEAFGAASNNLKSMNKQLNHMVDKQKQTQSIVVECRDKVCKK